MTLAGSLSVSTVNGFTLTPGMTFTILDNTSAALTSGTFSNAPGMLYTDARGDTFRINYTAIADSDALPNDVTLTVLTVVPEPSTWTTVGMALLLLAGAASRRRLAGLA